MRFNSTHGPIYVAPQPLFVQASNVIIHDALEGNAARVRVAKTGVNPTARGVSDTQILGESELVGEVARGLGRLDDWQVEKAPRIRILVKSHGSNWLLHVAIEEFVAVRAVVRVDVKVLNANVVAGNAVVELENLLERDTGGYAGLVRLGTAERVNLEAFPVDEARPRALGVGAAIEILDIGLILLHENTLATNNRAVAKTSSKSPYINKNVVVGCAKCGSDKSLPLLITSY